MTDDEGRIMQTLQRGSTRPRQSAIRPARDLASYVTGVSVLSLAACGVAVYLMGMPLKELVEAKRLDPGVVTQVAAPEYMMAVVRIGMGLFVLLLAFILSAAAWDLYLVARKLDRHGCVTQGRITWLWKERGTEGTSYHVAYEFGQGFRAQEGVQRSHFEKLHVGDVITVRFLPDTPQFSRPEWNWLG
jgi:hypothetical protein